MSQKIKTILIICISIVSVFELNAQTDTIAVDIPNTRQGEIVMSKSELINFLEKIAEARKEKLEFDLESALLQNFDMRSSYNVGTANAGTYSPTRIATSYGTNVPVQTMSRNELMREIEVLNSRLGYMSRYESGYASNGSTTFISTPGSAQGGGYYPYQTQSPIVGGIPYMAASTANGELRWKIDSLQRQVDMLSAPTTVQRNQDEISRLNREIDQAQDSLISISPITPEAKEIVKQYGTAQMQVFFDNDVATISRRYMEEVQRAATVLRKNSQLGVVLKGYASGVGSAKYNYDLSMRRNEAVKRMMIDYGVFPDQISSVFYGEDTSAIASEARRVDIKFIIK